MAKFVFELEAVLEQRADAERRSRLEVAQRQRDLLSLQERAAEVQRAIDSEREEMRSAMQGAGARASIERVRLAAGASLSGFVRLQRLALEAAGAQARLEASRRKLIAAAVAKKGIEVLKQRRYLRWKMEMDRKESAMLDDLVIMRHARGADELDADSGREQP